MRRTTVLVALLALSTIPDRCAAAPDGPPDDARRLFRDDLPYAPHIRRLTEAADAAWPTLSGTERSQYHINVYLRLADALQLLTGQTKLPEDAAGRRYQAAVRISLAIDGNRAGRGYEGFYKEVFGSREFNESSSAFRDAVIDLWTRYERAGKAAPYSDLLMLNQARMRRPDGQNGDPIQTSIATMYAALGDHVAEARWYEGVSPAGLGPLKAADALFAAGRYREAAERYATVQAELEAWAELKPHLSETALAEPLELADLQAIGEKTAARSDECTRRLREASSTRPVP